MRVVGIMLAIVMAFAIPAQAAFRIAVEGIAYEGEITGKGTVYRVDGKIVAHMRSGKERAEFLDENNRLIGYAISTDNGYDYFDRYDNPAGIVEIRFNRLGPDAVYKDRYGNIIGYSQEDGCYRRNFMDAGRIVIGAEIGSNALPLRPIPLEIWLRMRR